MIAKRFLIAVTFPVRRSLGTIRVNKPSFRSSILIARRPPKSRFDKQPLPILAAMISKTTLLHIISGQRHGLAAWVIGGLLWILTPVYTVAVKRRNRKFDADKTAISRVEVPVISVGNLTTGGTGKTPLVIWICQQIRSQNHRVAIVSRGYGAATRDDGSAKQNDEAMELQQRLPDVPHLQNPDRQAAASIAVDELEAQCIVMDDGFQHRRLHRDLDVVVVDATLPFGYGYVLPRGLLREPLAGLCRADFIVISRCDQVSAASLKKTVATIDQHNSSAPIAMTKVQPSMWLQFDGQQHRLESLSQLSIHVCCAIGNPNSFLATAQAVGDDIKMSIAGHTFFDDHHLYQRSDLETIAATAKANHATAIICTHKDLVKIGVNQFQGLPIYALVTEIVFDRGQPELSAAIASTLE